MKKFIYLISIMLLFSVVKSADFVDSYGVYRTQIKSKLNISTSNTSYMSDTVMNEIIREAVVQVNGAVKGIKGVDSFVTVFRNGSYTLDTNVTGIIDVYWSKNDSVKTLLYSPKTTWYQMEIKTLLQKTGYETRPSYYDYYDNVLYLYPIPFLVGDTIKVTVWKKVESISASDNLSAIDQKYRTAILNYAVYLVALSKQHPMTEVHYKNYIDAVNIINGLYNGGSVETTNP